jgi:hypothetical protein
MATLVKLEAIHTYATRENAVKAVVKKNIPDEFRYIIHTDEETGRFYPVFIGEKCIQAGIHFDFNVVV